MEWLNEPRKYREYYKNQILAERTHWRNIRTLLMRHEGRVWDLEIPHMGTFMETAGNADSGSRAGEGHSKVANRATTPGDLEDGSLVITLYWSNLE